MRRISPILFGIAALCACGYVSAAESQHLSLEGSASCPDTTISNNDHGDPAETDQSTAAVAPVRRTGKAKTSITPRGSSGTRASAPRWHSFLPGMFR